MIRWIAILLFSFSAANAQEEIIYLNKGTALRVFNGIETVDSSFGNELIQFKTYITNPKNGLLQFYSDGERIWDANHQQIKSKYKMPGCTDVFLTHKEKSKDTYYMVSVASGELYAFTISKVGSNYEVTDSMRLAYGIALYNGSLEMIRSCDGNSFWIIVAAPTLDARIYAFYATKDSVFSKPVSSPLRSRSGMYGLGFKSSPDGQYLASIYGNGSGKVDIYRFNRLCGTFVFEKSGFFRYTLSQHHGMCFSSDSRYLFVSRNHHTDLSTNSVIRFDITSPNLDSTSYRWDLNGDVLTRVFTVGTSAYILWVEFDRSIRRRWLDKMVDFRDTGTEIIPTYHEKIQLHNFPNVQRSSELNCMYDSILTPKIEFKCADDWLMVTNKSVKNIADSVLFYYGDTVIRFLDSFKVIANKTGWIRIRLDAYNCGFPAIFEQHIFIPPRPSSFSSDTSICAVHSGTIHGGSSIFKYRWTQGNQSSIDSFIEVNRSGKYYVSQINGSCMSYDSINVVFHKTIEPPLESQYAICTDLNEELVLNLPAGMNNYYLNGNQIGTSYSFRDTGYHIIKLIDQNKCEILDSTQIVRFCPHYLQFPNSFTPNNDGLNDYFVPKYEHLESYQLLIYSAWGELIYSSAIPENGWDGKIGQSFAPGGQYFYTCSYSYPEETLLRKQNKKGWIQLIR